MAEQAIDQTVAWNAAMQQIKSAVARVDENTSDLDDILELTKDTAVEDDAKKIGITISTESDKVYAAKDKAEDAETLEELKKIADEADTAADVVVDNAIELDDLKVSAETEIEELAGLRKDNEDEEIMSDVEGDGEYD
jgi:hypothetical protein